MRSIRKLLKKQWPTKKKEEERIKKIADENATEATEEYLDELVSKGYDPKDISVEGYKKVYDQYYEHLIYVLEDEFYSTNANVKEGQELVKKYDMTSWDELAKTNEGEINRIKKLVEHPKSASK